MIYKIETESDHGIIVDNAPVLIDVKDTKHIQFLLPQKEGRYCAQFRYQEDKFESQIVDGKCKIPHGLIQKALPVPKYVDISVFLICDDWTKSWSCDPIKITSLRYATRTQFEISSGRSSMTIEEQIAIIEKNIESITAIISRIEERERKRNDEVNTLTCAFRELIEKHNNLVNLYTQIKEEM